MGKACQENEVKRAARRDWEEGGRREEGRGCKMLSAEGNGEGFYIAMREMTCTPACAFTAALGFVFAVLPPRPFPALPPLLPDGEPRPLPAMRPERIVVVSEELPSCAPPPWYMGGWRGEGGGGWRARDRE